MAAIPDFTASIWQARRRDAQLAVSILDGKGTQMPAFRGKVPSELARDIVAVIRAFAPSAGSQAHTQPDDFEASFQALLKEFEGLRQQARAVSTSVSSSPIAQPAPTPGQERRQN
jgi:hypothetical protein